MPAATWTPISVDTRSVLFVSPMLSGVSDQGIAAADFLLTCTTCSLNPTRLLWDMASARPTIAQGLLDGSDVDSESSWMEGMNDRIGELSESSPRTAVLCNCQD